MVLWVVEVVGARDAVTRAGYGVLATPEGHVDTVVAHVACSLAVELAVEEADASVGLDDGGRATEGYWAGGGERGLIPKPTGAVGGFIAVEAGLAVRGEGGVAGAAVDDAAGPDDGVGGGGKRNAPRLVAGDGGFDVGALGGKLRVLEDEVEQTEAVLDGGGLS